MSPSRVTKLTAALFKSPEGYTIIPEISESLNEAFVEFKFSVPETPPPVRDILGRVWLKTSLISLFKYFSFVFKIIFFQGSSPVVIPNSKFELRAFSEFTNEALL